jgi:hypothetical protein
VAADVHAEDVWVCVTVGDFNRRVIIPVVATPAVTFLPDSDAAHPGTEQPPTDALLPSSACENNGGEPVVNADLGSSHVWLYSSQESSSRAHACVRAEGTTSAGGRLTIDTAGSPGVTPEVGTLTDQAGQCDLNVITNTEPVSLSVRRSSSTDPAWVCVDVEGTRHQVRLGASTGPKPS